MDENKTPPTEQARAEEQKVTAGQDFVKKIGVVGCIMFMLMLIMYLITCFAPKSSILDGYVPPHDSEYYTGALDELQTELEENVLPRLPEGVLCNVSDGIIKMYIPADNFWDVRSCILDHYDAALFEFIES